MTSDCVFLALKAGFQGIDTANQRKHYNEPGVGDGLLKAYKELDLRRQDLFIQSKYTYPRGQDHRKPYDENDPYSKQVRSSFESSLEKRILPITGTRTYENMKIDLGISNFKLSPTQIEEIENIDFL